MFGAGNVNSGHRHAPRRLRACGLVLAGLMVTTAACGSDDGGPDSDGAGRSASPSGSAPARGGTALTEAALKDVAFAEGERIGSYTARGTDGAPLGDAYTADPDRCGPLVSLAAGATAHDPAAEVHRQVDIADEMIGTSVLVQLRSYAGDGAAAVMKDLAAAGDACAGGYTEERAIARARVLKVEPAGAPAIGDEAVAFRFTVLDVKGKLRLYEYLTVVRSGSTTLSFRADFLGTKDIKAVPREIVDAQWKKFSAARSRA
ncbi:hypothetical protein J7E88_31860 [Streptomyces sp. ISL-10]|uniref:hypothetical protein n=1 Tax=Streptomyces sp. ISL-10 TaxID=2819172 RepID=UPI001BE7A55C|nr:hypothetical protein [Streptomyces sp. ISL-10]MBT2369743.1 hypothetical protein [Streptomyces sp. ISL-10]